MDHGREKASTFFTRLAYSLVRKRSLAVVRKQSLAVAPLSESLRSPGPQTSLSMNYCVDSVDYALTSPRFAVFELPNELILSILSHIFSDPPLTGHYARLRVQYNMNIDEHHGRLVRFLRPLSMTCKAMRLRLLPWIWEHLEPLWGDVGNLNIIANVDGFLASNVKYFCTLLCPSESGLTRSSVGP